jgi:hypothetical protein
LARTEDAIDLDAEERPSPAAVDKARVLLRRHEGHRQILIASEALVALGDQRTREAALDLLGQSDIYRPPVNYPRAKSWQIIPATGAKRRYFFVFSRRLRKFKHTDD